MQKITLLDGAMGTELRGRGCSVPSHLNSIWSAQVLLERPETVCEVHKDYIKAGADIIIANNYAVTQDLLERVNLDHKLVELTELSLDLAQQARSETKKEVKIAGSLPPLNTSYRADLVGSHASIVQKYTEILDVLMPKSDLIIIESMASIQEGIGALEACKAQKAFHGEIWFSFTLHGNRKNTLPSGESLDSAYEAVASYPFEAMLINCCATNQLTDALGVIAQKTDRPFGGYANPERIHTFADFAGVDTDPEGQRYSNSNYLDIPHYLLDVKDWIESGASIIGGCCRTRPEYIRRIREYIEGL